jgi:hypothetical protein
VDARLYDWLVDHGAHEECRADQVMVGFNVGAFDAPSIAQALPRSFSLFSRRYGDLNPLCFVLGHSVPISGGDPSPASWRRYLRHIGLKKVEMLGRQEAEHDAGTDALIALEAWREVESVLSGLHTDATRQRRSERERRISGESSRAG